ADSLGVDVVEVVVPAVRRRDQLRARHDRARISVRRPARERCGDGLFAQLPHGEEAYCERSRPTATIRPARWWRNWSTRKGEGLVGLKHGGGSSLLASAGFIVSLRSDRGSGFSFRAAQDAAAC